MKWFYERLWKPLIRLIEIDGEQWRYNSDAIARLCSRSRVIFLTCSFFRKMHSNKEIKQTTLILVCVDQVTSYIIIFVHTSHSRKSDV